MSSTREISGGVGGARVLSAAAATASLPAVAQVKPEEAPQVETIVVTGSRIRQAQLESVRSVAGVVNFVMNDHFQGVRFDTNYSLYQHDNRDKSAQAANTLFGFNPPSGNATDGYTREFAVIAGSNFAEGRGNATAYAGYRRVG